MAIKSENYILIPGWATSKLNLKGNDLLIYAIIYGFSQQEGQYFCGSLNYLQEWTQSTRQGVIKNIANLLDRNLIIKEESYPTNKYYANLEIIKDIKNDVNSVKANVNIVNNDVNSVNNNSKLSLQNNINNNIINNKDNKYKAQVELNVKVEEIISYFNSICHTNFKSNTAATRKLVKARLDEGFSVDDFKKVIELKQLDWGEKPFKFSNGQLSSEYLRPSTLFANKFESYVHEANVRESSEASSGNSTSVAVDTDISNETF